MRVVDRSCSAAVWGSNLTRRTNLAAATKPHLRTFAADLRFPTNSVRIVSIHARTARCRPTLRQSISDRTPSGHCMRGQDCHVLGKVATSANSPPDSAQRIGTFPKLLSFRRAIRRTDPAQRFESHKTSTGADSHDSRHHSFGLCTMSTGTATTAGRTTAAETGLATTRFSGGHREPRTRTTRKRISSVRASAVFPSKTIPNPSMRRRSRTSTTLTKARLPAIPKTRGLPLRLFSRPTHHPRPSQSSLRLSTKVRRRGASWRVDSSSGPWCGA